jgi:hypothetical protein
MHFRFGVTIALGLIPAAVSAATDIPTRYSGSFPSGGLATNLRGTFTGNSLTLRYTTTLPGGSSFSSTGRYSCVNKPPNSTRCDGTRTTDAGQTSRSGISIKWKGGKPIWAHIDKPTPL